MHGETVKKKKDLFSEKKTNHRFMGERVRETELLVSKLPWNFKNNHCFLTSFEFWYSFQHSQ
jgi:hypothetical protein